MLFFIFRKFLKNADNSCKINIENPNNEFYRGVDLCSGKNGRESQWM